MHRLQATKVPKLQIQGLGCLQPVHSSAQQRNVPHPKEGRHSSGHTADSSTGAHMAFIVMPCTSAAIALYHVKCVTAACRGGTHQSWTLQVSPASLTSNLTLSTLSGSRFVRQWGSAKCVLVVNHKLVITVVLCAGRSAPELRGLSRSRTAPSCRHVKVCMEISSWVLHCPIAVKTVWLQLANNTQPHLHPEYALHVAMM